MCCGALLSATAAGQDAGDAPQPAPVGDEVIVTGKSPGQLRLEMERAEEDVYDRLNRLNTDHRLDIHCHREAPINSHILRRACQPNYYRDAEAKAAQQELLGLQVGGGAIDTSMYYSEAAAYREALRAQMRRAANEDEQFQRALVRFVRLKQATEGAVGSPTRTTAAAKVAGPRGLPCGAAAAADVRVGRGPWNHELAHGTFTFSDVHGAIDRLEVRCAEGVEQPQYFEDAEWTLPARRQRCHLRVEAPRGTTFALYEFD